jgi:predicted  nucleic acid-binding Zn-ribbon protein
LGDAATPISKVLEMMKEMAAKGDADKKAEEVRFSAFTTWCGDQTRIKNDEIAKATDKMAELKAIIEKAVAKIAKLTDRIQELDEDVGRWKKDQGSAADVRSKETADYQATSTDYSESISAVDEALVVLKKQAVNVPQPALLQESLLQVSQLHLVPPSSRRMLVSFLQQPSVEEMPDERLLRSSPEAYAYESQSSGVVDMLQKLKEEFGAKKYELDKDEANAQFAFEQIAQQLTDNIENAEHEISKKTTLRAETEQAKSDAEGELAQTTNDRAEDQKYLDETTSLCKLKSDDFQARQQLRADELAAINEAIGIISSQAVAGSGQKHLPQFLQLRGWSRHHGIAAFVQVRAESREAALQVRLASFLSQRAQRYDSKLLSALSQQVSANPFVKVKKMIKDLIWKLMEEATAETEHKGWCDTELGTNKQTRDSKAADVAQLSATAEDLTAEIQQLTEDTEELTKEVAELEKGIAEAEEERATSKTKNEETVADAKGAQQAVEAAIAVLKDFYAKSAEATALVQQSPADDAPETFDAPYKGMLPEGGNVVDFLEVILTDFARLESETAAAEASEVQEFKSYMFESQKSKSLKENDKQHKSDKKIEQEGALHSTEEELKTTQTELSEAVSYYEKLKPTCVDSGATFEDRVKRREAEMASLQDALGILQGTDINLA